MAYRKACDWWEDKEEEQEEERVDMQCSLCDKPYKNRRSLVRHLRDKHKDSDDIEEVIKSVPKEAPRRCPFCRQPKTNIAEHKRVCKKKPDSEGRSEKDNDEWLEMFTEEWLKRPAQNYKPNSWKEYRRYVSKFIEFETDADPNFRAWHWTANPKGSDFRNLRDPEDYVKHKKGTSYQRNMGAAWKQLYGYVSVRLDSHKPKNPFSVHDGLQLKYKELMKKVRNGTFDKAGPAKDAPSRPVGRVIEGNVVDPEITRRVTVVWQKSKLRRQALNCFSKGRLEFAPLGIVDRKGVAAILALELLIRGKGIRLDAVLNLTLADIMDNPRRRYERCPYCHAIDDYLAHKKECTFRENTIRCLATREQVDAQGGNWQDYDSGNEQGKNVRWVVTSKMHKTDKFSVIEHNLKKDLLDLLQWFCNTDDEAATRPKSFRPFEKVTREQVLAMLGKIIKAADAELWATANQTGPFGAKAFRRLAVKDIFRSKKNVAEKCRGIGLDEETARKYYDDRNYASFIRSNEVEGVPGASRSHHRQAKRVQSPPSSDSDSDSEPETGRYANHDAGTNGFREYMEHQEEVLYPGALPCSAAKKKDQEAKPDPRNDSDSTTMGDEDDNYQALMMAAAQLERGGSQKARGDDDNK